MREEMATNKVTIVCLEALGAFLDSGVFFIPLSDKTQRHRDGVPRSQGLSHTYFSSKQAFKSWFDWNTLLCVAVEKVALRRGRRGRWGGVHD